MLFYVGLPQESRGIPACWLLSGKMKFWTSCARNSVYLSATLPSIITLQRKQFAAIWTSWKGGLRHKTYGGAILGNSTKTDLSYTIRNKTNVDAKNQIAAIASRLIEDGDHLMLDDSSTSLYLAKKAQGEKGSDRHHELGRIGCGVERR